MNINNIIELSFDGNTPNSKKIFSKQFDNLTRTVTVKLGTAVPHGAEVKLRGTKPDCTVFDIVGTASGENIYVFLLTENALSAAGMIKCDVVCSWDEDGETKILSTEVFYIENSGASMNPDAPGVAAELESLEKATAAANSAAEKANSAADNISEIVKGADGKDGTDGVSATHFWEGTVLTVTSASGTTSADLKGEKGDKGERGDAFIYDDFSNEQLAALKGEKGDKGDTGAMGVTGKNAFEYAKEGGYAGTETEFRQKMAKEVPTVVQEAGESESLVMSQKAVTDLVNNALGTTETEYETVDSVEEMTDTSKQYVLNETGTLWAYGEVTVEVEPSNKFVASKVTLNQRIGSSDTVSELVGMYVTNYMDFDGSNAKSPIVWLPLDYSPIAGGGNQRFACVDGNGTKVIVKYVSSQEYDASVNMIYCAYDSDKGRYYVDMSKTADGATVDLSNVKQVRFSLYTSKGKTTISAADIADVEILFENDRTTSRINEWYDTGLTPSTSGGSGNYVALLVDVQKNSSDIAEIDNRVNALENESDALTVPSFWKEAVDVCISKIKTLQSGKNCVTFPFFSDNHQRNGYAGMLIAYIMKECNIPYCFYGGDSISSGTIADEATMIAQDKAFDRIMSYVPNGRFCRAVGNHDGYWYDGTNKYYYNRDQVYELFLREESVAQNKHFGDDGTYYYVDDIASKVRFVVLNTNEVDSIQLSWLQNTALNIESGWAVVLISHQPLSNHYHALIDNASEVISAIEAVDADIVGCFSGHIHRDRIYTGSAVNTSDDSIGTALPFTQVTITSDHTGIAYDNSTKHTVANDNKSHAIDFVTINKATRTVNITRLGIGEDRSFTY